MLTGVRNGELRLTRRVGFPGKPVGNPLSRAPYSAGAWGWGFVIAGTCVGTSCKSTIVRAAADFDRGYFIPSTAATCHAS